MKRKSRIIGFFVCVLAVIAISLVSVQIYANAESKKDTETYVEESNNYYYYYEGSELPGTALETPISQDFIPTEE